MPLVMQASYGAIHSMTGTTCSQIINWWIRRLERGFSLTDRSRIDHFRGLSAYWSVPAESPDTEMGSGLRAWERLL